MKPTKTNFWRLRAAFLCIIALGFSGLLTAQNAQFTGTTCVDLSMPEVYSVPAQAGATYTWVATNGTIVSGAGTHTVTIEWNGPGQLELTVVTDAGGDKKDAPITLSMISSNITGSGPGVSPRPFDCILPGETYTYEVDPPSGGSGSYTYQWDVGGTGIGTIASPNSDKTDITWNNPGHFPTLRVKITDGSGCVRYLSQKLNRFPDATIQGPKCIDLSANPTHQYYFSDMLGQANNSFSIVSGSASLSFPGGTSKTFFATFNTLPTTIRHTMTNTVGGCTDVYDLVVNDNSMVLDMTSTESCNPTCNGTASVSVSGGGGPFTYNWSQVPATAGTPGPNTPSLSGLCPGFWQVQVTNAAGCPSYGHTVVQGITNFPNTFHPASTTDLMASPGSIPTIFNTGNDIHTCAPCQDIGLGPNFKAMVWDGPVPTLAWDDGRGSVVHQPLLNPNAMDPDVIVGEYNEEVYVVVVYEDGGIIYYEHYIYDSGTLTDITPPANAISAGLGFATHANITYVEALDSPGFMPNMVVVWEESGRIGSRIGFLVPDPNYGYPMMTNNTFFQDPMPVSPNTPGYSKPDVTGYHSQGSDFNFIFTYLHQNGSGTNDLIVKMHDITEVQFPTTKTDDEIEIFESATGMTYDNPRIASPRTWFGFGFNSSWQVVAEYKEIVPGGHQFIHGINGRRYYYTLAGDYVLAEYDLTPCDMNQCGNSRPVVDYQYSSGQIIVAFEHSNTACGGSTPAMDEEIVALSLNLEGVPNTDDFAIVNWDNTDRMTIPSVAGRYASQTDELLYTYFELNNQVVWYKGSAAFPSVRKAVAENTDALMAENEDEASLSLFPNPTTGHLTLEGLQEGEVNITVFNLVGSQVLQLTDQVSYRLELDLSSLPQGVYTVQVEQAQQITSQLVVKN